MRTSYLRWDAGVCQGSEYSEGFLTVQPDLYGEEASGGSGLAVQAPYGFLSRPLDPDDEGACQVLYAWEGSEGHVLLGADARVLGKLPTLKKGGSIQYGATGTFSLIDGENGSKLIYVPYDFNGAGVAQKAFAINVDVDNQALHIVHGDGMSVVMADGRLTLRSNNGQASITLDGRKVTISGDLYVVGSVLLGIDPALPLPPIPRPVACMVGGAPAASASVFVGK